MANSHIPLAVRLPWNVIQTICVASSIVTLWSAASAAPAPYTTAQIIYEFATPAAGRMPVAGLVADAQGRLYGTTQYGGTYQQGVVFRLTPPSSGQGFWTEEVLHNFDTTDGAQPVAPVTLGADGSVYGTTLLFGPGGLGTVFKLANTPGWPLTTLHSFVTNQPGNPNSAVVFGSDGLLYGTVPSSSATSNRSSGNDYRLSPQGDSVLFQFLDSFGKPGMGYGTVGLTPVPKKYFDGFLGANPFTETGINEDYGSGSVYGLRVRSNGTTNTAPIYNFGPAATDVTNPASLLLVGTYDLDGLAFGCTQSNYGGGGVYQLTLTGGHTAAESVINTFSQDSTHTVGAPFVNSSCSLVQADPHGSLLGTTDGGGTSRSGTVFRLDPPATAGAPWHYSALFTPAQLGQSAGIGVNGPLLRVGDNYFFTLQGTNSDYYGLVIELLRDAPAGQ